MYNQLTSEQRSQIFAHLQDGIARKTICERVGISQSTLCRELKKHCRHKMKYRRRKGHKSKMSGRTLIPNRVSIHQRPAEADGTRFGDWEMDLIIGKGQKSAVLTMVERKTNMSKGTDFRKVEQAELDRIQAKINRRPREKLNFSSPLEQFRKHFR